VFVYAEDGGDFLHGQSTEEAEFDELRLLRVDDGELMERVIKGDEVAASGLIACQRVVELNWCCAVASLGGAVGAGAVDEDAAHELGANSEEVGAVVPLNEADID